VIRALASWTRIPGREEQVSSESGAREEFDPGGYAQLALSGRQLHRGLATEQLIETLLSAPPGRNVMDLPMSDADRNLLAAILMKEEEELTAEHLQNAMRALQRIQIKRKMDELQRELQASMNLEPERLRFLLQEKERLKRALMDPRSDEVAAKSA